MNAATKLKILGLNAAKLYGIDVPQELRLPDEAGTPAAKEDAQLVESSPQEMKGCTITVSPRSTLVTAEPISCTQPAFS